MKLYTFDTQTFASHPYPPYTHIVSVPSRLEFQLGTSGFTFEYRRQRRHRCYTFLHDNVTIDAYGIGGYHGGLRNCHHGLAVKYLASEADLRVLNHLYELGLGALVEAVGRHRARAMQRAYLSKKARG